MTAIYAFGPFRLDVAAGILFRGADPVALGQRAIALLQYGPATSNGALVSSVEIDCGRITATDDDTDALSNLRLVGTG
jgi:hypothetical protein